jgi:hypothetical protein
VFVIFTSRYVPSSRGSAYRSPRCGRGWGVPSLRRAECVLHRPTGPPQHPFGQCTIEHASEHILYFFLYLTQMEINVHLPLDLPIRLPTSICTRVPLAWQSASTCARWIVSFFGRFRIEIELPVYAADRHAHASLLLNLAEIPQFDLFNERQFMRMLIAMKRDGGTRIHTAGLPPSVTFALHSANH